MTTRTKVCDEAMTWLRTPYVHLGNVKHAGVDCAMLLVGVYINAGLVAPDLDPRPYSPNWHLHQNEERYLGWVEKHATEVTEPLPGDVVLWRFGRAFSHGAILLDTGGTIVHAYRDAGCVVLGSVYESQLLKRQHRYYRINGIGA